MERIRKILAISRSASAPAHARAIALAETLGSEAVGMLHVRTGGVLRALRPQSARPAPEGDAAAGSPMSSVPAGNIPVRFAHLVHAVAPQEVLGAVRDSDADLVVVDHQDRSLFGQLISGYDLDELIRACDKPILIARKETAVPYRKALVAVDFSPQSSHAARVALALAPREPIAFVHAFQVLIAREAAPGGSHEDIALELRRRAEAAARARMETLVASLGPRRQLLSRAINQGTETQVLTRHIGTISPDLVAIGKKTAQKRERRGLGKVLETMIQQENIDLLIAPPGNRGGDWFDKPAA